MNTYSKFGPNVYLAKCQEKHIKGAIIPVTSKYGKENPSIVYNLIYEREGFFYYSIIRNDGVNFQERAKAKSERLKSWSESAENKAEGYKIKSEKDKDFLVLGEPIKVGHHSEKRHRKALEDVHRNTEKRFELLDKSESLEKRAEYWEKKAGEVNLSMPESLEYYEYLQDCAKKKHDGLKSGEIERSHSFSLTYAKKDLNLATKNIELAKRLWA